MRLNFEFTPEQVDQLNKLKIRTGVSSMKELFNNAFAMLDWAVDEVQSGRDIAALSVAKDNYRIFVTPLLRQVKVNNMPVDPGTALKPVGHFDAEYATHAAVDQSISVKLPR